MKKFRCESQNGVQDNIARLAELFPSVVSEGANSDGKLKRMVDFESLRQLLSEEIQEGDERYQFTWPGKKAAIVEAGRPIRKTFRPCTEESVDFDMTENLYIEGDNLDVLKLLRESYFGKVRMIYIDPPYNTGNDLIYIKAAQIINGEKAAIVIEHISYDKIAACHDADIFTSPGLRGELGKNAIRTVKHLYDYLVYDARGEKEFAQGLESDPSVELYIKLPKSFHIPTPMGNYSPDWAIAFQEGEVKHVYFVAETKGSLDSLQLRAVEKGKIACARKHFAVISSDRVKYDVVTDYADLVNRVLK